MTASAPSQLPQAGVKQAAGFPVLGWLKGYDRAWLRFDLIAALTTWALVVPQAIAYGQIAGLPPQAGIFTAFAGLLVYALLGTSRQLIVTPMSAIAAISAAAVAPLAMGDVGRFAALSATLAIVAGCLMILFGILKLGFVSQFIATAVQSGLMFGLGLTIVATQVPKILGIPGGDGTFIDQVVNIVRGIGGLNAWTLVLGVASLVFLFAMPRFLPKWPAALILVAASILLVTVLHLPEQGVDVLGHVDRQIPLPKIPAIQFGDVGTLFAAGLGMALIMYAESDTVSEEFATKHRYQIRENQELYALGAANIAAGLFQGFITGGGASQSAANESAGAKSQMSGLIVAGLIFLTAVLLMPIFTNLAQAVLAAIVIKAVVGFVSVPKLRHLWNLRRESFWIAMVALFAVLIFGMLPGLIIAIVLCIALAMGRGAQPTLSEVGLLPDGDYGLLAYHPEATVIDPRVLAVRVDYHLSAANIKHVRRVVQELAAAREPKYVVLDLELTNDLDVETVDVLEQLRADLAFQGTQLVLSRVHGALYPMLDRSGLTRSIGAENIFATGRAAGNDLRARLAALDAAAGQEEVPGAANLDVGGSTMADLSPPKGDAEERKREFFAERAPEIVDSPPSNAGTEKLPASSGSVEPESRKEQFFHERDMPAPGE